MCVSIERQGGRVVVGADDRLVVGNRRELQQHVLDALEQGERLFVVDMGATGYVDSAGLGTLVMLAKRVRARGGELRLVNLNEDVRALFALTKLDTVFALPDSMRHAPAA